MTNEQRIAILTTQHPELAHLIPVWLAMGAKQERERQAGVRAQVMPGYEALIEKLSMDGKTTPGEAAMAITAAQRAAYPGFNRDAPMDASRGR